DNTIQCVCARGHEYQAGEGIDDEYRSDDTSVGKQHWGDRAHDQVDGPRLRQCRVVAEPGAETIASRPISPLTNAHIASPRLPDTRETNRKCIPFNDRRS